MMVLRTLLASTMIALTALFPAANAYAAPEPYTVDVLISLTGAAAFLGGGQKQALELLEAQVNKSGGINGRPLHFAIQDDGTSPQTALQLASEMIARHAPIILGGSISATCRAVQPLINENTIQYCFSPAIAPPRDGYVFSSLISTPDLLHATLRYARSRGWTRIAMISSNDASGQDGDRGLAAALAEPENASVHLVSTEHFSATDLSVAAQLTRITATNPQALFVWTPGPAIATVLRGVHDSGIVLPVVSTTAAMTLAQMTAVQDIFPTGGMYFPATQLQQHSLLRPGPLRDAQGRFLGAFAAARHVAEPTMGTAWDPGLITIDALRHIGGNPTAKQLHDYIEQLHGFPGIYSLYDFRDHLQRGMGANSAVVAQWVPAKHDWIAVTGGGGAPLH